MKSIIKPLIVLLALFGFLSMQACAPTLQDILMQAEKAGTKISDLNELTDTPDEDDETVWVDTTPAAETKRVRRMYAYSHLTEVKSAGGNILSTDGTKVILNTGAAGNIEYNLPECLASPDTGDTSEVGPGWWIVFQVADDVGTVEINPDANDIIADFAENNTKGETIISDSTRGTMIKLVCEQCEASIADETDAYNFISYGYIGSWTETETD